jgi:hypothetical protein
VIAFQRHRIQAETRQLSRADSARQTAADDHNIKHRSMSGQAIKLVDKISFPDQNPTRLQIVPNLRPGNCDFCSKKAADKQQINVVSTQFPGGNRKTLFKARLSTILRVKSLCFATKRLLSAQNLEVSAQFHNLRNQPSDLTTNFGIVRAIPGTAAHCRKLCSQIPQNPRNLKPSLPSYHFVAAIPKISVQLQT